MNFWLAEDQLSLSDDKSHRGACVLLAACFSIFAAGFVFSGEGNGVASIAEREVQRRQALVRNAQNQLIEADTFYKAGKYQEAVTLYSATYQSLPNAAMAATARDQARSGLATASCALARQLMNEARYAEAAQVLDALLAPGVDPDNADAKQLRKEFADTDRYPAALTPVHIANVKRVQELLQLAASFHEIGDFDRAIETYKDVLRVDSFNTAARRGLEKAEQARTTYFDAARDHTRASKLAEIDSLWEQSVPPTSADLSTIFGASEEARATLASTRNDIIERLRTTVIPKLDFSGASLDEVVEYLRIRSRDLDPKGRGVDFVLNLPADSRSRLINLSLEQVPLEDVLRYVTQMAGAAYRVEERAVTIVSLTEKSTQMVSRTYRVPANFIQTAPVDAAATSGTQDPFAQAPAAGLGSSLGLRRIGAKEFLEARGVVFPDGASAAYNAATSTLTLRNTVDNIAIVDSLVDQALGSAPKQVIIMTKIMEVNDKLFQELGTDISLGASNLPGSERLFVAGGGNGSKPVGSAIGGLNSTTEGLRSSGEILGKPSIDALINASGNLPAANSVSPAFFSVFGVFTDPSFELVLRGLSQKKGVDLVSVPSVMTKSGVKATITMAREFPYPTEFDPPEIPQNIAPRITAIDPVYGATSPRSTVPITPTTPTAFEVRDVGVTLEAEPVISEDGRTVEVNITGNFTEFEGFIDYGSDIQNEIINSEDLFGTLGINAFVNVSGGFYTVDNPIIQPVFRVNKLNNSILVWDGSTIALGGVIYEKTTDINDKVPLLGDIPILGRLWQSKVKQVERKNFIMFLTVKVVDSSGKPLRQESKETVAR
jgi:general secretion pathway protein D